MNLKNGPDVIKYFMFEPAHYDCTKCKTLENVFFFFFLTKLHNNEPFSDVISPLTGWMG